MKPFSKSIHIKNYQFKKIKCTYFCESSHKYLGYLLITLQKEKNIIIKLIITKLDDKLHNAITPAKLPLNVCALS